MSFFLKELLQIFVLQVVFLNLTMDGQQIMHMDQCKLSSSFNSLELRKEREAFTELSEPMNKAWKLTVSECLVTFPFKYNFAFAFHEQFVSLMKWLKTVHLKVKESIADKSNDKENRKLPPDIILNIKKWVMSVEDDPFEVKLRYNYELMEDEYHQSCKRSKAFNARMTELQRSGAFRMLTAAKVEELHKSLKEKDSETYIKRSRNMYESTPTRSDVFSWVVEDALIFAMADPSMDGEEKVKEHLEDIDTAT